MLCVPCAPHKCTSPWAERRAPHLSRGMHSYLCLPLGCANISAPGGNRMTRCAPAELVGVVAIAWQQVSRDTHLLAHKHTKCIMQPWLTRTHTQQIYTCKHIQGTVVAVTHDRYFLDNVAGWILELDRGQGIPFEGNYSGRLRFGYKHGCFGKCHRSMHVGYAHASAPVLA